MTGREGSPSRASGRTGWASGQGICKVGQQVNPSVRPELVEGPSVHGSTSSPRTAFELIRTLHKPWGLRTDGLTGGGSAVSDYDHGVTYQVVQPPLVAAHSNHNETDAENQHGQLGSEVTGQRPAWADFGSVGTHHVQPEHPLASGRCPDCDACGEVGDIQDNVKDVLPR